MHDGGFDAGPVARIKSHRYASAGWGREKEITKIGGEHPHRLFLCPAPQPHSQINAKMNLDLGAPSPACGLDQPLVARAPPVANPEATHDPQLVETGTGICAGRFRRLDTDIEDPFLLGSK